MKATEARMLLGFPNDETHNPRYSLWRLEVLAYMQANGIKHQTQAGTALWKGLQDYAIGHQMTQGYKEAYNGTDAIAQRLQEALQVLLFDIRAKMTRKRKDATKSNKVLGLPPASTKRSRVAAAAAASDAAALGPALGPALPFAGPPAFVPRGVIVYLTDPAEVVGASRGTIPVLERQWGGRGVLRYVGMVYEPTMEHLVSLALRKLEGGPKRGVRNLLGAMADPVLGASGVVTQSPDSTLLVDDEDVEGWLATTTASPLRLLAILERSVTTAGRAASQTPPPHGWQHIDNEAFGTVDEPVETSDEAPATKKRRRPTSRKGYEQRLERLRGRQSRLGEHIAELEGQLRNRFPSPVPSTPNSPPLFPPPRESETESEQEPEGEPKGNPGGEGNAGGEGGAAGGA